MEALSWILYGVAGLILGLGWYGSIRAGDLIRLLISLELMFNSVFLALIPLFTVDPIAALGVLIAVIMASAGEFMVFTVAILSMDRVRKSVRSEEVRAGGEAFELPW